MAPKGKKALEDVYQKKTQLEHVLLRPDTYIGSVESNTVSAWIHDGENMVYKEISLVPGLYKIFDEILVNAADNKVRDAGMGELRVQVDPEENLISVLNDGEGIPIEVHKKEGVYIPELIFGHLLTSSNFDDDEKKMTGGRNGYGAKLANIFSTEFKIETGDGEREYSQVFRNNMTDKEEPEIKTANRRSGWTRVSFKPDLAKFGMTHLDDDVVSLLRKRTYDMAGLLGSTVKVYFNGQKIGIKTFKDYVELYLGKKDEGPDRVYKKVNDRWEVVVSYTQGEFRQISFVNSICTMKGGTHVNHVVEQICKALVGKVGKKAKVNPKPYQVKNHLHVFINCMIENPAFDSQTKDNMTTKVSEFGSKCILPDEFLNDVAKIGIVDHLVNVVNLKSELQLKKTDGTKTAKISVPKLDDAKWAGTAKSAQCTLILTEGDSAKSLAVAGLSVIGREAYGVFPLRGKLLNVRDASNAAITKNAEIQYLKQIIGLKHREAYEDTKRLRYGHILIMTDQDHDGSHIKGLIINFLHHCHPSLIQLPNFVQCFITPIVKARKDKTVISFYTVYEFEKWREERGRSIRSWSIKYYKGLGTSGNSEVQEYFADLDFHIKEFVYKGEQDDKAIIKAFSKDKVEARKAWLAAFVEGTYIDNSERQFSYETFIDKELIQFSLADIARSIPSVVDGLKVAQRKIIFGLFKKNLGVDDLKVVQLVGFVSEHAAYHHGEASLAATIINLAQNYVGSNNINLLAPRGQFGTRLKGGKDSASPRYLHTNFGPLTKIIFNRNDNSLLEYLEDDGQSVQPRYYVPIIPMVLVNGAEGIGTGWSTFIPSYNPLEIIDNILMMLDGLEPVMMHPWYMGFSGNIEQTGTASYVVTGRHSVAEDGQIEIQELPIRKWTEDYKEFLRTSTAHGNNSDGLINGYDDGTTTSKIHFTLDVSEAQMAKLQREGIEKVLKLKTNISTNNMVLFNENGGIRRYSDVIEILKEFFVLRKEFYAKRRDRMLKEADNKMKKLSNTARFIKAVIEDEVVVAKRKMAEVIADLERLGFDKIEQGGQHHEISEDGGEGLSAEAGYKYLLNLGISSLTLERAEALMNELENQKALVAEIESKTPNSMWKEDLFELREKYILFLNQWEEESRGGPEHNQENSGRGRRRGRGGGRSGASASQRGRRGGGGRGGRGQGRKRAGPSSSRQTEPTNQPPPSEFQGFQIASVDNGDQSGFQVMNIVTEIEEAGDEAMSPAKRDKRRDRASAISESENSNEAELATRARRPKRQKQSAAQNTVSLVMDDEETDEQESEPSEDQDSDYKESQAESSDSGSE